jgi:hypothetical protein
MNYKCLKMFQPKKDKQCGNGGHLVKIHLFYPLVIVLLRHLRGRASDRIRETRSAYISLGDRETSWKRTTWSTKTELRS